MRPVSTLSGGQRRRLDVAIGLVHTPRLLFLDEPSTGLDPQNRANLQEQIAPAARRAGHHDRADHALPRGGRRDRRPGGRHRPRPGDRRRHREPAQVRARRPGHARLRRRAGGGAGREGGRRGPWAATPSVERTGTTVRDRGPRGAADRVAALSPTSRWPGAPVRRIEVAERDPRRRLPRADRPQPAREQRDHRHRQNTGATPRPKERQHDRDDRLRRPAPSSTRTPRGEPAAGARRPRRHLERHGPRAAAGLPRAGVRAVRDGAAAGLPRPVRAAAAEGRGRLGAAVVRARHHRDDRADGRVVHRRQPDPGDRHRLPRAAAGLAAVSARRCWSAGRSRRSCRC